MRSQYAGSTGRFANERDSLLHKLWSSDNLRWACGDRLLLAHQLGMDGTADNASWVGTASGNAIMPANAAMGL